MAETLLTIPKVAARHHVSQKRMGRLLTRGEMPGFKFASQCRVDLEDLEG
ncbi:MAG: hypothetical protein O7H41_05905 [Planctomycetota bacterium]|nr:hypothetical protein [Planctomycetota bacterium]